MAEAFRFPVTVFYEDTDAGQVVYHANYLRYFERARSQWLRSLGFDQSALAADPGVLFAVRAMDVEYQLPARLDDKLQVTVEQVDVRRASLRLFQQVMRPSDNACLCTAQVRIACLRTGNFRPRALPDPVRQAMHAQAWAG